MRRKFSGGRVGGKQHPTTAIASPWNSLACIAYWKSVKTADQARITIKSVLGLVKSELGVTSTIVAKIRRLDIWVPPNKSATDRNSIVFAPCDFTRATKSKATPIIEWFEAWGTAAQPAHVHYIWPSATANLVVTEDDEGDLGLIWERQTSTDDPRYIMKVHLVWRVNNEKIGTQASGAFSSIRSIGFEKHNGQTISEEKDWQILEEAPDIASLSMSV